MTWLDCLATPCCFCSWHLWLSVRTSCYDRDVTGWMLPYAACGKQEKNLDWFPRMRAMSLAADDAESEQNELRNLQAQLAQTNELVETLSRQLNELKEQVSVHSWLIGFHVDRNIHADTTMLSLKTTLKLRCPNSVSLSVVAHFVTGIESWWPRPLTFWHWMVWVTLAVPKFDLLCHYVSELVRLNVIRRWLILLSWPLTFCCRIFVYGTLRAQYFYQVSILCGLLFTISVSAFCSLMTSVFDLLTSSLPHQFCIIWATL